MSASWEKLKVQADQSTSAGDFFKASEYWLKALEELDDVQDADPRVAATLDQLADTLEKAGEKARAVPVLEHCVKIKQQTIGADNIEIANTLNNLAELYYSMGHFDKATPLSERIMSIYEKSFGSNHPGLAMIASFLALLYHGQEEFEKAERHYKTAMSIKQKTLGYNHPEVGCLMENYAAFLSATGRTEEAETIYQNHGTVSGLWKAFSEQSHQAATQGKTGLSQKLSHQRIKRHQG